MRSVMGALLQGSRGFSARIEVQPRALFARATGVNGAERLAPTVRWGHGESARLLRRYCCLGLERENPFRTAGKMNKPLRC
jgi:hypothetical protein